MNNKDNDIIAMSLKYYLYTHMVSGRYFNKGVKSLDSPHVGHVVRETSDKIVVFGEGDDRYDIPKDKIRFAAANVLIDLPFHEIVKNYKVSREQPLPIDKEHTHTDAGLPEPADLATYEGKYPKSLFNKGVRTQDEEHIGHVMTEAGDKIVVWGHYNWRFDVPKSKIIAFGRNVILGMDYNEVFKYKVDRDAPLPTGEPVEKLGQLDLPFEIRSEGSNNNDDDKRKNRKKRT